jgi:hypothetical protein
MRPAHKLPPSPIPHTCLILAIDPGKRAGAALVTSTRAGTSVHDALGVRPGEERRVVESACRLADSLGLTLVVVGEKWTAGRRDRDGFMQAKVIAGLGAAWGRWEGALLGAGHPARRTLRVNSARWKGAILRLPFGASRDDAAFAAKTFALRRHGLAELSTDAAVAVCIAEWASRAGEVGEVLPRKVTA